MAFPGPPGITVISLRRNESSTAFLSHWLTDHVALAPRSATRAAPRSSRSSAASTASRTGPLVAGLIPSRCSKASSMVLASSAWDISPPVRLWRGLSEEAGVESSSRRQSRAAIEQLAQPAIDCLVRLVLHPVTGAGDNVEGRPGFELLQPFPPLGEMRRRGGIMLAPDAGKASRKAGQATLECAGVRDVLAAQPRPSGIPALHLDRKLVDLMRIVDHKDAKIFAVRGPLLRVARQPPPRLQRLHLRPRAAHAGRSDQHQRFGARAGLLRQISRNQSAHGEAGYGEAGLRSDDRVETAAQRSRDAFGRNRWLRVAGFAGPRQVRNDHPAVLRQRLDVAQPVHPASSAAVQQHERRAFPPDAPNDLAFSEWGGAAHAGAIERGDEIGG